MPANATILGCEGHALTDWEKSFFRDANPWGFILFARNIGHPDQLRALTSSLRDCVGRDAPVLIDQEGGRVQRMRAPYWREYLPALDQMQQARDPARAQWLRYRLIAQELHDVGIDVNCAPLADIAQNDTHPFLRNRLYGTDPQAVTEAAQICAAAHLAGGVLPVLKHMPGHGQATVDSHLSLPTVTSSRTALEDNEFAPFRALSEIAMAMTCHLVFTDIDPENPATTSTAMMQVIRRDIGFGGLIMTDDISMEALSGDVATRSRAALDAGCDLVLHCNGKPDEMQAVVDVAGPMSLAAIDRADHALSERKTPVPIDISGCVAELDALLR